MQKGLTASSPVMTLPAYSQMKAPSGMSWAQVSPHLRAGPVYTTSRGSVMPRVTTWFRMQILPLQDAGHCSKAARRVKPQQWQQRQHFRGSEHGKPY